MKRNGKEREEVGSKRGYSTLSLLSTAVSLLDSGSFLFRSDSSSRTLPWAPALPCTLALEPPLLLANG